MGALYGVAGVAHAADCLAGPSDLLTLAGAPPFYELPALGLAFALLWCLSGPAAYACARVGGRVADAGLVQYGAIECFKKIATAIRGNQKISTGDGPMTLIRRKGSQFLTP